MSDNDFNYEQRPLTDEYLEGYDGIKWEAKDAEETREVCEESKQDNKAQEEGAE